MDSTTAGAAFQEFRRGRFRRVAGPAGGPTMAGTTGAFSGEGGRDVANTSIIFGLLLAILGAWGFFGSGMQHPTALIPAGVGLVLVVLGALATRDALRKHAMHAAAAVGALGFLFGAGWFIARPFLGKPVADTAGLSTATMAVLCGAFVAVCVKSFLDARRRRKANAETPPPGA